jgi:hypothetical protein
MAAIIGVVSPKSGGATATVPIDLLSQDGVPPEQGDTVSFSVDATVKSVSGDNAVVSIQAVNGEPVNGGGDDSGAEDQEPDEDDTGGPPQPGGQAGGASGAGGRGGPMPRGVPLGVPGGLSPSTLALGAALKKKARGQPLPF